MRRIVDIDHQVARYQPIAPAPTLATDAQAAAGRDPRGDVKAQTSRLARAGAVAVARYASWLRHAVSAAVHAWDQRGDKKCKESERRSWRTRPPPSGISDTHPSGAGASPLRAAYCPWTIS